jgi:hypothetical protein
VRLAGIRATPDRRTTGVAAVASAGAPADEAASSPHILHPLTAVKAGTPRQCHESCQIEQFAHAVFPTT